MHQDRPGVVVGARRNSPLVIGLGEGENFLGSDVAAFVEHTKRAMEIGQDEIVTIRPDSVEVTDFAGNPVPTREFEVAWDATAAEKGGWPSFMKKEISEEPEAVGKTLLGRVHDGKVSLPELDVLGDMLDRHRSHHRDRLRHGRLRRHARAVRDRDVVARPGDRGAVARVPVPRSGATPNTLVVSVSQSGETMDTLMAVKYAKEQGARTLSICNTQGSTIPRESDAVLYIHAGPEVAVASTKAFVAQVTALYLLGLDIAQRRGALDATQIAAHIEELQNIPAKLDQVLE